MARITFALADDLRAELQGYLAQQREVPNLTVGVQPALRSFLLKERLAQRPQQPSAGALKITPAAPGSGRRDAAGNQDPVIGP